MMMHAACFPAFGSHRMDIGSHRMDIGSHRMDIGSHRMDIGSQIKTFVRINMALIR